MNSVNWGEALGHSKATAPSYEYELIGDIKKELDCIDVELAKNEAFLYTSSELRTVGKKRSLSIYNVQGTNGYTQVRELEEIIKGKDRNLRILERKRISDQQLIEAFKRQRTSQELQLSGRENEVTSLQKKLRESEKNTQGYKKSQYRVQDLNNQLVERIKNLEGSKENTGAQQFKTQVKEL